MTALSSDASALLMCLSGPPQRATNLRTQIGWPEDRFARALAQLVNSYPPQIEIFGSVEMTNILFALTVISRLKKTTMLFGLKGSKKQFLEPKEAATDGLTVDAPLVVAHTGQCRLQRRRFKADLHR